VKYQRPPAAERNSADSIAYDFVIEPASSR